MKAEDFDLARWVGPLIPEGNRRVLKAKLRDARELKAQGVRTSFTLFPLGREKAEHSFDRRFEYGLHPNDATPDHLHAMLTRLGAPSNCRVLDLMADEHYEYGSVVPLSEALEWALGEGDGREAILLCVPGRLAYYQNDHGFRAIVYRERPS